MHATASVDSVEASDRHTYRSGAAVHVVATTLRATRAALGAATTLAKGLESRVHVIAAGQTPSEWSLDQQLALVHTFAKQIMDLTEAVSARVDVLPCVCRRPSDVVQLLSPHAVVVIGGRLRWWWASPEQRLAHALTARSGTPPSRSFRWTLEMILATEGSRGQSLRKRSRSVRDCSRLTGSFWPFVRMAT
jgi:hypothetical protein